MSVQKPTYAQLQQRLAGAEATIQSLNIRSTEVSRMQEKLRSCDELCAVVETMNEGLGIQDRNGIVTYVNQQLCEMLGYSRDEFLGRRVIELIDEEYRDDFKERIAARRTGDATPYELVMTAKDGRKVAVLMAPRLLLDAEGRFQGSFALVTDIADRKRAEERLQAINEELEHRVAQRTNALEATNQRLRAEIAERIRVEKALRGSERQLSEFFENAPIGLNWVGPDGIILRANQAELDLLGYRREEYVGRHIAQFHADQDVIDDILIRLSAHEVLHDYEARLRGKDGSIKHVLIDSNVLWTGGRFIHTRCFTRDVTQRKRAQDALTTGERRFRMLADNVPQLFAYVDRDERYGFVNHSYEQLFGLPKADFLGKHIREILGEDGYKMVSPNVQRVLAGERVRHEQPFPLPDGRDRWTMADYVPNVDDQGQVDGFFVLTMDITPRKQAEEALRQSEGRLRAILDTAVDAIITIDDSGVIESANPAAVGMLGYDGEEMIGNNVKLVVPSPFRDRRAGTTTGPLITGETVGRRKDGSTFPVDLAVGHFHDRSRRYYTAIIRDISEQKKLQRHVLEATADEQRRIGQDLHDGTQQELIGLEMLARDLAESLQGKSDQGAKSAVKLTEGINRANRNVRLLSRGLVPVEVDDRGLMSALTELATRTSQIHGITCRFEHEQPVEVRDNFLATHLYRIAQEAVTNALKHSQTDQVVLSLGAANGTIILKVLDNGVGIDEGRRESQGMGLQMMAYRAALIGATLHVGGGDGGGTLVSCTFS